MRISIFGLGYVGAVCSACLVRDGHEIVGVDVSPAKVDLINAGQAPIVEKDLPEYIAEAVAAGRLRATTDAAAAVAATDLSFVCVGTPSGPDGAPNLDFVRKVCAEIGAAIAGKADYHVVVMRSTVLPGTVRGVVVPELEAASGKIVGRDFGVASNPEFLRESSAIRDYHQPPKTVIGEVDAKAARLLADLYSHLNAPLVTIPVEAAEMVKFADNAWHAAKVAFANEIGNVCKAVGVDGHVVMDVFCQDEKLNISKAYLKPGYAFGGSCLPKDVRALGHRARELGLETPLIASLMPSNAYQIGRAVELVERHPGQRIGMLGLSFKAGTDDLRESPLVELAARLVERGYDVAIYDSNVSADRLTGANRDYVLARLPDLTERLTADLDAVLAHGETFVVGNRAPEFRDVADRITADGHVLVDLVRIADRTSGDGYEGICW